MKFFTRKDPKEPSRKDELKLRLLRQMVAANETQKVLGQITEAEYDQNIARCLREIEELEVKYGISDEQ